MAPMFSIVMPTRSRARTLRWALQTAVNQDFEDYEIVVVDNHSTDDTAEVARTVGGQRTLRCGSGVSEVGLDLQAGGLL